MAVLKKILPVVVLLAAGACASASWAGGFALPHTKNKNACPTAVEKPGAQANAFSWGESKGETQDMRKAGGDASKVKGDAPVNGQTGMLLPAVKTPAVQGKHAIDAGKAGAVGAQ